MTRRSAHIAASWPAPPRESIVPRDPRPKAEKVNNPFKAGDRVVGRADRGANLGGERLIGREFVVRSVDEAYVYIAAADIGPDDAWWHSRFDLVQSAPPSLLDAALAEQVEARKEAIRIAGLLDAARVRRDKADSLVLALQSLEQAQAYVDALRAEQ